MTRPKNGKTVKEHIAEKAVGVVNIYHGRREMSFTTSLGVLVWVSPLPPLLPDVIRSNKEAEWLEQGRELPEKPTYTTKNVAGDEQTHEHDEQSLTTPEDKAAWATWQATKKAFDEAVMTATFEEHARNGIRFEINPEWVNRYKRLRPPVNDEAELRWFYTRLAVIGSRDDVLQIMTIASRLTGVDDKLIAAAEGTFRSHVEKADAPEQAEKQAG